MSDSTCNEDTTAPARGSSSGPEPGDAMSGQETSPPGPFRPWGPVARLIQARFKGTVQHVALQLARHTQRDGVSHMTARLMTTITGYHRETCRSALAEIAASGLVVAKKTRDGYVYQWSREAYTGAGVTSRTGNTCSTASWQDLAAPDVDGVILAAWQTLHKDRYKTPLNLPAARRRSRLTADQQVELRENLQWLAESRQCEGEAPGDALQRSAADVMAAWFERPGRENWLRDNKHPLARLCEDFADVATALIVRDKAKVAPAAQKPAFTEALRDRPREVQETFRAGSKGLLAVLTGKSAAA